MRMHELLSGLMISPLGPAIAVLTGAALGLFFHAGLWWTVQRIATFRRPALSVLTSMLLRMGVTLSGFYLVAGEDWVRLLFCLSGFVLARIAVTWLTRLPSPTNDSTSDRISATNGSRHAP